MTAPSPDSGALRLRPNPEHVGGRRRMIIPPYETKSAGSSAKDAGAPFDTSNSTNTDEAAVNEGLDAVGPRSDSRLSAWDIQTGSAGRGAVTTGPTGAARRAVGGERFSAVDGNAATEFDDPEEALCYLAPRERGTWDLRMTVVRYLAGIEPRSYAEIASEFGVTRAAVSRVYKDVIARLGCRQIFANAEKRRRLAEAAKRHWADPEARTKRAANRTSKKSNSLVQPAHE